MYKELLITIDDVRERRIIIARINTVDEEVSISLGNDDVYNFLLSDLDQMVQSFKDFKKDNSR